MNIEQLRDLAIEQFDFGGEIIEKEHYGSGHINDTFCIVSSKNNKIKRFILQRMNTNIFKNPDELMENIYHVTEFLKKKIKENGGDIERETLSIVKTKDGKIFYKGKEGDCWRAFIFLEGTIAYDLIKDKNDFYEIAVAFGNFQRLLSEFDASVLHETIPNFHNTVDRLNNFKKVLEEDAFGRKKGIEKEIKFVLDREKECAIICDLLEKGEIPLRVTHNDTKINNILVDEKTKKGICVIDLDTVMPGTVLNDYGDSIRFGASTALEDEKDLEKVECSMELFEIYTKGFLEGSQGNLTEKEKELLPMGAKIITLECGIRFLTDYLQGDTYFKTSREGHNLDRARTQFKLVYDMEQKWEQMQQIAKKYC